MTSPYEKEGARLDPQHLELIKKSAIIPQVCRERGYRTITEKARLADKGFSRAQCNVPGLLNPIFNARGEYTSCQFRPDTPRQGKDGKLIKYESPIRSRVVIDVHPFLSRPRKVEPTTPMDPSQLPPLILDSSVPLVVTEGVRKADSAVALGLCAVAILGVAAWRRCPDWNDIPLKDRTIYLCFDSDVIQKRPVLRELRDCTEWLRAHHARVQIIRLPPGPHGEKIGLDDWIAARLHEGMSAEQVRAGLVALGSEDLPTPDPNDGDGSDHERGPYFIREDAFWYRKLTREGEIDVCLSNFVARITADLTHDDGVETSHQFAIEVNRSDQVSQLVVPAEKFSAMNWPCERSGANLIITAGLASKDRVREAIQRFSLPIHRRTVYAHTGWRQVDDVWLYLHAGGAIGATGLQSDPEVALPPTLAPLRFGSADNELDACRASLRLLEVGPSRVTVPVYGCIWRAIIGAPDFSVFELGETGNFKTAMAALAQQHFGAGFDAENLPASFTSTANWNEGLAFVAKDALLVVDELHPPESGGLRERMNRDAGRLIRAQGNRSGRGRMRPDGSLRPAKPPRGLILATGEELPSGQSGNVRMLIVEVHKSDLRPAKLAHCQADAAAGLYAAATGAFIRWLAGRYEEALTSYSGMFRELRSKLHHEHPRTAHIVAQLTAAYSIFLGFLRDLNVVDKTEADQLQLRVGQALNEVAIAQKQLSSELEPTSAFLRLLSSALGAGRAHLASHEGDAPESQERACGWRLVVAGDREYWQPQGERVGWLEGTNLYLNMDAAYGAAQRMAPNGGGIEVSSRVLVRRLRDRHFLLSTDDKRETCFIRRTLEGRRRSVIHLSITIGSLSSPEPDQSDQFDQNDPPPDSKDPKDANWSGSNGGMVG
jgi:hypothetical protein